MRNKFIDLVIDIKSMLYNLKEKLLKVPERRKIEITFDQIQDLPPKYIYKPRFVNKRVELPQNIKADLSKLIDDLFFHLEEYSPNSFKNIEDIIDLSTDYKKSLIYLVENDVYATHDIYGDYLVEIKDDQYEISYYRREKKAKTFPLKPAETDIKEFIRKDAILQIKNQIEKLCKIIEIEIERCENRYKSQMEKDKEERVRIIKEILEKKENEILDFKINMYKIDDSDLKTRLSQRKEFLKDILGLINNKKNYNNNEEAHLIIGIGETKGIFNGYQENVEFNNFQLIRQLLNEFIYPIIELKINDYYFKDENEELIINSEFIPNSNRILLITFYYELGTVYELKKKIGNPAINIEFYYEGTSFIRDGSHTRRITQQDRRKIMNLRYEIYDLEQVNDIEYYPLSREEKSTKSDYLINSELITNYVQILNTKKLSFDNLWEILSSVKSQFDIFIRFYEKNSQFETEIINFIKYACNFIRDGETRITHRLIFFLDELSSIPQILKFIKNHCLKNLISLCNKGDYYFDLISLLYKCSHFEDIFEEIFTAIKDRNREYLNSLIKLDFNIPIIKKNKWEIIQKLVEYKELLTEPEKKSMIGDINRLIRKLEHL